MSKPILIPSSSCSLMAPSSSSSMSSSCSSLSSSTSSSTSTLSARELPPSEPIPSIFSCSPSSLPIPIARPPSRIRLIKVDPMAGFIWNENAVLRAQGRAISARFAHAANLSFLEQAEPKVFDLVHTQCAEDQ